MTNGLHRVVGLWGAVLLGLGSILGTGVFVSIGLVADVAGPWTVLTIVCAAAVAACNGLSSAQLAASHPVSGGTYEYGNHYLGPWSGFAAGWMFLCAKSASAATAALGVAAYLLPEGRVVAALLVVAAITAAVVGGIRRSNLVNAAIVAITLAALAVFVAVGLPTTAERYEATVTAPTGLPAFLEGTALMFVAFTGYGRIATLGEEVVEPQKTIPRAIVATLIATALIYVAVAAVGGTALRGSVAPLEDVAKTLGVAPLVALGACTAMLGVLLNLVLGLSRVALAMARRQDLPTPLAHVDHRGSPTPAVLAVALLIALLVTIGDVKTTWSFSAFTVLVYYALTNLSALRMPRDQRRFPVWIAVSGLAACLGLAFFVDRNAWIAGLAVLAAGFTARWVARTLVRREG
jgi:APA family basic amino acid/polyamine antiporter